MVTLDINGKKYEVEVSPEVPLLWVIREHLKLTGTKFGCGVGMCGACTVQVDGEGQKTTGRVKQGSERILISWGKG